jgi:hypothetical protein
LWGTVIAKADHGMAPAIGRLKTPAGDSVLIQPG